jgi:hypothetical protein
VMVTEANMSSAWQLGQRYALHWSESESHPLAA